MSKKQTPPAADESVVAYIIGKDPTGGTTVRRVRAVVTEVVDGYGPDLADNVLAWLERDLYREQM